MGADTCFTTSQYHSGPDGFCVDDGEIPLRYAAWGEDVPSCTEPDQIGWGKGPAAATFPPLSTLYDGIIEAACVLVISPVIYPWAPALERLTHMCVIS
ncbi:MAG: hypothetical protein P0121_09930, partial [Nitrospira sp.]|nr:hypothetical protein [Nitrospira sp.]